MEGSLSSKVAHPHEKGINEILKSNNTTDKHVKVVSDVHRQSQEVPTGPFQQVVPPGLTILEDNSVFPAWAIALVVLCLVILFVLVILIFY